MMGGKSAEEVPAEKSESGPDSGTDDTKAGRERGDDGKFKASDKEPETSKEDKGEPAEDGPQKRINKAVKAQREAERKAAELERQIEELKKGKAPEEKKEPAKASKADEPKKPKAEDFQTYEDYIDALTDYKADIRDRAREAKEAEKRQSEANDAHKKAWEKKVEATREKHPDYDDVMAEAGDTPISRAMHNAIAESDIGPELAYYLATNTDKAKEIAALSPTKAIAAMARLEDKLTEPAENKKPATKVRELPKPPRNIGGSATPRELKLDDPDIPLAEFKRIAQSSLKRVA